MRSEYVTVRPRDLTKNNESHCDKTLDEIQKPLIISHLTVAVAHLTVKMEMSHCGLAVEVERSDIVLMGSLSPNLALVWIGGDHGWAHEDQQQHGRRDSCMLRPLWTFHS